MDSTRWHQLAILQRLAAKRATQGAVLFGGDLNTLPPGTKKQKGFDDSACPADGFVMDDYTAEATWLQPLYDQYAEAIPLEAYQANEARYYSHTVNGKGWWNRRLDYLFTNGRWTQGAVLQDSLPNGQRTFPLSDHAPLVGVWHRQ
jgi:endonuclease/exonuclease/phosphatase family metal-dependent hydrolase